MDSQVHDLIDRLIPSMQLVQDPQEIQQERSFFEENPDEFIQANAHMISERMATVYPALEPSSGLDPEFVPEWVWKLNLDLEVIIREKDRAHDEFMSGYPSKEK